MSRPLVVLDLDGPILDVSQRYFEAHRRVTRDLGVASAYADAQAFWDAKRSRIPHAKLYHGDVAPEDYVSAFRRHVEADDLLIFDRLQDGALAALSQLTASVEVLIVSLRTNVIGAQREVERLGVTRIAAVHFVPHSARGKAKEARMLAGSRRVLAVAGDSEADAQMGQALRAPFVGLESGIRDHDHLVKAGAVAVLPNLLDFAWWLSQQAATMVAR